MSRRRLARIGAAPNPAGPWLALPSGEDVTVPAGDLVALVASVKASHTASDLAAFAARRGLTIEDYAEEGQRPGLGPDPRAPDYRYVAAIASAPGGLHLPWEVPWPASIFDDSQLVSAWIAPDTPSAPVPPAPTPPAPTPPLPPARPSTLQGAIAGALVGAAFGAVVEMTAGPQSYGERARRAARRMGRPYVGATVQWSAIGAIAGALLR